jgi:predicted transcriptional regulator
MKSTPMFDGPFLAIPRWARIRIAKAKKGAALEILCTLVDLMNIRTKVTTATVQQIAEHTNLSCETTKRMLHWLEQEGVVKVTRSGGKNVNQYHIQYKFMGSPMTPQGVTHDPIDLPDTQKYGVTHDPINTPKNTDLPAEMSLHRETYSTSIKNKSIKKAGDSQKVGPNMIIGSDPESTKTVSKISNTVINDLTNQFIHHRSNVMRVYPPTDVGILRRTFKTLLKSGLAANTIQKMIDNFLNDSRFASYENPILGFASKKIQKVLIERINASVTTEDPVIMLLLSDFDRGSLDMPWDIVQDSYLRTGVTTRCLESLYRYPELVVGIIYKWAGDFKNQEFLNDLSALDALVKTQLGKETHDIESLTSTLSYLSLPKDLLTGNVRESAGTIVSAIYQYRRTMHV